MKTTIHKAAPERLEEVILFIRGYKVILDADLARLYMVENRSLIQAVKRNHKRFPQDFVFQLTREEFDSLRSQSVISKVHHYDSSNAITVPVTLSSDKELHVDLLGKLDTGSSFCIFDKAYADLLGLDR